MITVALLARTSITPFAALVQGRHNGKPVWILFDGDTLDVAKETILARHAEVYAQCRAQMPEETTLDTPMMTNVRIEVEETRVPHTYRAKSWSYATLKGWVNTPAVAKNQPSLRMRANG